MADILIIDDDPAVHAVLSAALKSKGHVAVSAMNGVDGVNLIKQLNADLIVLDFEMPGLSGEAVFEQLRLKGVAASVPVLFLSSLPLSRQVGRVDVSRNVRFLRKPVVPADFFKALGELLPAR